MHAHSPCATAREAKVQINCRAPVHRQYAPIRGPCAQQQQPHAVFASQATRGVTTTRRSPGGRRGARLAAAAPDTLVDTRQEQELSVEFLGVLKDMQTVRGVLHTSAPPDLVYGILTAYERNAEVFAGICASDVRVTEAGDKQVVQVRVHRAWARAARVVVVVVSLAITALAPSWRLATGLLAACICLMHARRHHTPRTPTGSHACCAKC